MSFFVRVCFCLFNSLHPSQQFFNYVQMLSTVYDLNRDWKYLSDDIVTCGSLEIFLTNLDKDAPPSNVYLSIHSAAPSFRVLRAVALSVQDLKERL